MGCCFPSHGCDLCYSVSSGLCSLHREVIVGFEFLLICQGLCLLSILRWDISLCSPVSPGYSFSPSTFRSLFCFSISTSFYFLRILFRSSLILLFYTTLCLAYSSIYIDSTPLNSSTTSSTTSSIHRLTP